RPCGLAIAVHTRVEIPQTRRGDIVHRDELVIRPIADEGQTHAIGREAQVLRLTARVDQLRGFPRGFERGGHNLPRAHEVDTIARYRRSLTVADSARLAAGNRDHVD